MFAKVHEKPRADGSVARVIAVCDADLLGCVLKEGGLVVDLDKYRSFYEGEPVEAAQLKELLDGESNLNVVGEKSVAALGDLVDSSCVKRVQGVPLLHVYRV
jgi:hypothetical protein